MIAVPLPITRGHCMRTPVRTIPAFGNAYPTDKLAYIRHIARLMDSRFEIPGTKIRFGIDPIIGFFLPGIGSIATSAVSCALVATMARHGASGHVVVRMLLNVLIDTIFGSIPLIGSVFDVAFRANDRNVELLRKHYDEGRYSGSGRGLIVALVATIIAVAGAVLWLVWQAVDWMWGALQG